MKRWIKVMTISTILFLALWTTAFAVEETQNDNTELADYLKEVGLFQGSSQGYMLEQPAMRVQGAVMIVRLMGKEKEAQEMHYEHPFLDVPEWANDYVGYLWVNGLTKGVSETTFGSSQMMTASQYATYLLRCLNYDDSIGDFSWNESLKKAKEIGMISQKQLELYTSNKYFLRDDMVLFSFNMLDCDLKGTQVSMLKKHIDEGVVPIDAMLSYQLAPYGSKPVSGRIITDADLKMAYINSIIHFQKTVELDITGNKISNVEKVIKEAEFELSQIPGYYSLVTKYGISKKGDKLKFEIYYSLTKDQFNEAVKKAKEIATQAYKLSDYEKALFFHDYIIDNTRYVFTPYDQTMYGVLIKNEAVCMGYTETFGYLCMLSGIDSINVLGEVINGNVKQYHAWNLIKLDGENYIVDVTWDDPTTKDPTINIKSYKYFNVTDDFIKSNHIWDEALYPKSTGTKYNYYVYNSFVATDVSALTQIIQNELNNKATRIDVKLEGGITQQQVNAAFEYLYNCKSYKYTYDTKTGIIEMTDIVY